MICNKDVLLCSTCQGAYHEHLELYIKCIAFIHELVFTVLSVLGCLWHFVPSSVGANSLPRTISTRSYNALIKYTILTVP